MLKYETFKPYFAAKLNKICTSERNNGVVVRGTTGCAMFSGNAPPLGDRTRGGLLTVATACAPDTPI